MCKKLRDLILNDFYMNSIVERKVICMLGNDKLNVGSLYTINTGFKKYPTTNDAVYVKETGDHCYLRHFDLLDNETFYIGL